MKIIFCLIISLSLLFGNSSDSIDDVIEKEKKVQTLNQKADSSIEPILIFENEQIIKTYGIIFEQKKLNISDSFEKTTNK